MIKFPFILTALMLAVWLPACKQADPVATPNDTAGSLKIAYVNGDSVLHKYDEFRKLSDVMEAKQRKAEDALQSKLTALEKEFMAYQQKAQSGTMTGKEMEAREKYLGSRQEALMAERDQMAKAIMEETQSINKQLKTILDEKLDQIKAKEGYDFILNYVEGGAILSADAKYDITDEVLKLLNEDGDVIVTDTSAAQ